MARGFFITGTDTDVGKTTCALGLMRAFKNEGFTVAAMKPVSAGCERTPQGLRNEDALRLMKEASVVIPYEIVNPYAFEAPIAPHIAATEQKIKISIEQIKLAYQEIAEQVDVVVVEGAGGWLVPINERETMAEVAKALNLDIIQIVGVRLGCLNHALLTDKCIASENLNQIAWIANHLNKDMQNSIENIQALKSRISGIYLGEIFYSSSLSTDKIAQQLSDNINQIQIQRPNQLPG